MDVKSTRLRSIKTSDLETLELVVNKLPFKIEIKGQPMKYGRAWVLFFVIPDGIKWESIDLTG